MKPPVRITALFLAITGILSSSSSAAPDLDTAALNPAFLQLKEIQYGQDRGPLDPIREAVLASSADEVLRQDLEKRFMEILQGAGTVAAKDYSCRALKLIGSSACVPALAALLSDQELSGLARYALEAIPDPAALQVLREALPQLSGKLKVGVISSLGALQDPTAVVLLTPLLNDTDTALASAAATALGNIATLEAVHALAPFLRTGSDPVRRAATIASLEAADRLLEKDSRAEAAAVFQEILQGNPSGYLHLAAFQGLVAALPNEANARLLAALKGKSELLRNHAARLITDLPGTATPRAFLEALPNLPPPGQVALLGALRLRQDLAARSTVLKVLDQPDPGVRTAALETLGVTGTAADVPVLARWAAAGQEGASEAARASLAGLRGAEVNQAIAACLPTVDAPAQVELLRCLSARQAVETAPVVASYIEHVNEQVRRAAVQGLGDLGNERQIPPLLQSLATTTSRPERETIAGTLRSICSRVGEKAGDSILPSLRKADPDAQALLLQLLSNVGGSAALSELRAATQSENAQVQDAAIRELANWPDPIAGPDLLRIVQTRENRSHQIVALRGYIRLCRKSEIAPSEKLKQLGQAMDLSQRSDEKKLVLAALGDIQSVASLELVARSLNDPELADEAGAAVVRIVSNLDTNNKDTVAAPLAQVLQSAKSTSVLNEARKQRRRFGLSSR